jgi:hypothetical protein
MSYRQDIAAEMLGVSISTLKRRYYEFGIGRWPIDSTTYIRHESPSSGKGNISTIINDYNIDEKFIDKITLCVLLATFNTS